jgi:hypothetical protein
MFIAGDATEFSSSVRSDICQMSLLTELENKKLSATNITLLAELLRLG